MSDEKKFVTTGAAAALALFFFIAGPVLGWPWPLWLLFGFLPPTAATLLVRSTDRKREQQRMHAELREVQTPPPPPPEPKRPGQEVLSNVSLRSAAPDYRFLLSGTVYWLSNPNDPGGTHGNPGALAREAIVSRAAEVLETQRPEEHSVLTERLNGVLGAALLVPPGGIEAWGQDISVALPEDDRKRLHRLAAVRKEEEVWEHERNHERNVREYLGEDVLRDPGRAVVWWLARHHGSEDSGLRTTVNNVKALRDLTSAAHSTEVPEWQDPEPAVSEASHDPWASPFVPTPGHVFTPSGDDGFSQPSFVFAGETSPCRDEPSARPEEAPAQRLLSFVEEATAERENDERSMLADRIARVLDEHAHHEIATELRKHFDADSYAPTEADSESIEDETGTADTDEPHSYGPDEYGQV